MSGLKIPAYSTRQTEDFWMFWAEQRNPYNWFAVVGTQTVIMHGDVVLANEVWWGLHPDYNSNECIIFDPLDDPIEHEDGF